MDMKRIQFRLKCPNPLFEQWLGELYQAAVVANSSSHTTLKKALQSLKKYPLVLSSGSECAILRGFGTKLCKILDRKLAKYRKNVCIVSTPKVRYRRYSISLKNDKASSVDYTPQVRSESYAILVTILTIAKDDKRTVSINELERNIQQHCNKKCLNEKLHLNSEVWSSVNKLIQNELIIWKMDSNDFSLTRKGKCLAKKLLDSGVSKVNEVPIVTKNIGSVPSNDKISIDDKMSTDAFRSSLNTDSNRNSNNSISDDNQTDVIFLPNSFDVLLLVDKQETSGTTKKSDPTVCELNKFGMIEYELRHLKVGDFTWVARHYQTREELVLPYIVERKRIDDLGSSIKDGRFHEQKFRLKQCGIPNVIYMIENYGENQRTGLPMSTLMQATTNTRIQDGFLTHFTASLPGSIKFLAMMTKNLQNKYKGKTLKKCNKENTKERGDTIFLLSFSDFNKSSSKSKTLSVSDMFIKQLLQIKGISIEKALSIVTLYKTPSNLMKAFENEEKPDSLLSMIKSGDSKSNISPVVGRLIYKYFTSEELF